MSFRTVAAATLGLAASLYGVTLPAQTPGLPELQPRLPPDVPPPMMLPDLTITAVQFEGGVFYGQCNRVRIVIRNAGHADASGPVPLRFTSAITSAESTVSRNLQYPRSIAAGATATLVVDAMSVSPLARNGAEQISVTVDPDRRILESSQTNNSFFVPLAVLTSGTNCPALRLVRGSAIEGSPIPFMMIIDRSFPRPMSVSWRTQQGAAIERPLCGGAGDYAGASGTVVFPAGTTTLQRTVYVQTCRDTEREPIDTPMSLQVTGSVNVTLPTPASVTGVIQDNLAPP